MDRKILEKGLCVIHAYSKGKSEDYKNFRANMGEVTSILYYISEESKIP